MIKNYRYHTEEYWQLAKNISKMRQEFRVLQYYWKIRCDERKTLTKQLKSTYTLNKHIINLEKGLQFLLNNRMQLRTTDHRSRQDKKMYSVWLTHNDALRLKGFLSNLYLWKDRVIKRPRGKYLLWLNKKNYNKAKYFIQNMNSRKLLET